ncbi:PREDICTED: glutathione S-transferase F11 isoform X1 [Camelina sativa]|uniref:glutathione transferase n=2 Tax=Camelina sativa TaxID=90675 RepID=A0ABM1RBA5_CAMSA|nr:PREDICTED: glutathione S-transferase F11 isoform X1 [Camelina sativa]
MASLEMNDLKKIGLGLTGFGVFFTFLGVIFVFGKGLIAMGNILFLAGVTLTIGIHPAIQFFTTGQNFKISFGLGFFLYVVFGWPIFGLLLESCGFLVLFSGFCPTLAVFLQRIPLLGWLFQQPYIRLKMVVKVYGQIKAANPQRVLLCFLEKGIEFEVIHVDLDQLEQKKPEHLLRQPFGQVPAIEDGDLKLFESRAIVRYYATKYADQGTDLLGKTLEKRAIVDQWVEVENNYLYAVALPLVINVVFKPKFGEPCDVTLIEELKVKFEKVLDVYENRLATNRYLAGDEFTLADLTHMPGMRYIMNETTLGDGLVTSRENVNRWWNEISARPAWKKLMDLAAY